MSPEYYTAYLSGSRVPDPDGCAAFRNDVYGLGATAFEMLTGVPPARDVASDLLAFPPGTPPWMSTLISSMLCEVPPLRPSAAKVATNPNILQHMCEHLSISVRRRRTLRAIPTVSKILRGAFGVGALNQSWHSFHRLCASSMREQLARLGVPSLLRVHEVAEMRTPDQAQKFLARMAAVALANAPRQGKAESDHVARLRGGKQPPAGLTSVVAAAGPVAASHQIADEMPVAHADVDVGLAVAVDADVAGVAFASTAAAGQLPGAFTRGRASQALALLPDGADERDVDALTEIFDAMLQPPCASDECVKEGVASLLAAAGPVHPAATRMPPSPDLVYQLVLPPDSGGSGSSNLRPLDRTFLEDGCAAGAPEDLEGLHFPSLSLNSAMTPQALPRPEYFREVPAAAAFPEQAMASPPPSAARGLHAPPSSRKRRLRSSPPSSTAVEAATPTAAAAASASPGPKQAMLIAAELSLAGASHIQDAMVSSERCTANQKRVAYGGLIRALYCSTDDFWAAMAIVHSQAVEAAEQRRGKVSEASASAPSGAEHPKLLPYPAATLPPVPVLPHISHKFFDDACVARIAAQERSIHIAFGDVVRFTRDCSQPFLQRQAIALVKSTLQAWNDTRVITTTHKFAAGVGPARYWGYMHSLDFFRATDSA